MEIESSNLSGLIDIMDRLQEIKAEVKELLPKLKIIYNDDIKKCEVGIQKNKRMNRMACRLYFSDGTRKHLLFSRLNYEAYIGRVLDRKETVDHIDGDPTNDSIENLQILSTSENSTKGPSKVVKDKNAKLTSIRMLSSDGDFARGVNNHFAKLSEKEVLEIKELQKSYTKGSGQDRTLTEKYNVSTSTVKSIRRGRIWKQL